MFLGTSASGQLFCQVGKTAHSQGNDLASDLDVLLKTALVGGKVENMERGWEGRQHQGTCLGLIPDIFLIPLPQHHWVWLPNTQPLNKTGCGVSSKNSTCRSWVPSVALPRSDLLAPRM